MSKAKIFAALFGDDGQNFETDDGRSMDDVLINMSAEAEYSRRVYADDDLGGDYTFEPGYIGDHYQGDPIRYTFLDGSAIVVSGNAWDYEGAQPFSWRG